MDAGDLEFSRHDEICTGRCASRNLGGSKYDAKIECLKTGADYNNAPGPTGKSRRKNHHANQSGSDLASLRTLLSGPALTEPGYSVLREAQGECPSVSASPSTSVHTPPIYSNQPVFPSAIMVPANVHVKIEPTSQCSGGESSDNQDRNDYSAYSPNSEEDSHHQNHSRVTAAIRDEQAQYQDRREEGEGEDGEFKVAEAEAMVARRTDVAHIGSSHMNGGTLIALSHHHALNTGGLTGANSSPGQTPVKNIVELNRDMMEAIKFASDLPDSDSLLEGEECMRCSTH